jgi:uroporphyrin-3 C-methyltransferase
MRLGPERCFDVIDAPESERFDPAPAVTAPPAPPAAPARGSVGSWLFATLVVLALAYVAYVQWLMADQLTLASGTLRNDLEVESQRQERMQAAIKTLETRLTDAAATNKVLREELLAMGERASLLEDAVARLADNRLRGEVMLRLNEAEFLLLLGEERLRLFGDVPAAIQAFTLTDAALAGMDDPSLATLRQTLAQELIALREVPPDPRPALRAELAQLAATLPALPESRAGEVRAADANDSRLVRLLSGLVTVRRVSERDAVLGPVQRETTLAALRLQLELAQAALARPDVAAFQQALDAAAALADRLFDAGDARVGRLLERLRALRATTLLPQLPVLGATLQELRGLRAARSVGSLQTPTPALEAPAGGSAEDADVEGGE